MAKRENLEFQEVSQTVKYPRQLDTPETTIRTSAIASGGWGGRGGIWVLVICLRTHSRLALKIRGVAQSYDERMAQHLLGNGRGRDGEVASIGTTPHAAGS